MPKTLFEKIWDAHVVAQQPDSPVVLYIDLHLVHEVTSPQAFTGLRIGRQGKSVQKPRTILSRHGVQSRSESTLKWGIGKLEGDISCPYQKLQKPILKNAAYPAYRLKFRRLSPELC